MTTTKPVALATGASSGIGKAATLALNNAGVGANGAAEEISADQARRVFDVNVFGLMRMTRTVLPRMREQGGGRIVNVSSVGGFVPNPFMAVYVSTKHAVEDYSESLDHEVRAAARLPPPSPR